MPNPGEALGDPDRREADLDDDEGTSTAAEVKGRREWTEEEWREWDERWWHAGQSGWYGSPWRVEHVKDDAGAASTAPPQSKTDPPDPWQQRSYDPWSRRTSVATGQADQHFQGAWSTWWAGGYQSKGDYSDPPSWSGWNNYRLWRRALLRWNANTDVAIWRRAEKVLKTLDWDLQAKLDHLTETTLSSPSYLTEILSVLDILSGEKEDSDRRRAVRAALFEGARKPDEGLAQYALRRESQFELANRYVSLPEDIKGILLEEQSGLPRQAMQNLRVLTKGQHSYSEVKKALQILDLDEESMIKSGKTSYFGGASEVEHSESDIDDEEIFLALEAQEVDEEEALCLMADLQQDRKRTWRENKLLKAARKKDRRHFDDRSSRPSRPFNRRKMSIEEIKKVTFCNNCGKKGHWREDCPEPPKEGTRKSVDRSVKMNAFAYLGVAEGSASSPAFLVGDYLNFQSANSGCFLEVAAGHAIVDPGASQDLIGLRSYEKLEKRLYEVGLRTIKLEESPSKASGVGGDAKSLFMALSPCVLGGQPGVIKLTVVADDIPQLLSIGLLEYGKAIIDTGNNRIRFQAFDTETTMKRLPSGHRLVDIADWDGSDFPIPAKLSEELGLPPRAFNVPSSERRAYMAASPESVELFHFLVFVGVSMSQLSFESSAAICDPLLGNFFTFREFTQQDTQFLFRTSWLVHCNTCCLLELNAKRERPNDAEFQRDVSEVTDCPLDFTERHWSTARVMSLFSQQRVRLETSPEHVFTLHQTDRPSDASRDSVSALRDQHHRAQSEKVLHHGVCGTDDITSKEVFAPRPIERLWKKDVDSLSRTRLPGSSQHEGAAPRCDDVQARTSWHGTIRDRGHQEDSTTFRVLPSQGLRGQGCESTRNLDQMLDVSDQVDLCPLQQGQSSSGCPHDQVSDGGDLCEQAGTSHAGRFERLSTSTHDDFGDLTAARSHAGHPTSASGPDTAAGSEHCCRDVSSHVSCHRGISPGSTLSGGGTAESTRATGRPDAAAVLGTATHHATERHDEAAGRLFPSSFPRRDPAAACAGLCRHEALHAAAGDQRGRGLGCHSGESSGSELRDWAAQSFTSQNSTSDSKCIDSHRSTWLTVPFSQASRKLASSINPESCFIAEQEVNGTVREVFLLEVSDLSDELVCHDYPEGREAQLTRKHKRLLLNSLQDFSAEFDSFADESVDVVTRTDQEPGSRQERKEEHEGQQEKKEDGSSHAKIDARSEGQERHRFCGTSVSAEISKDSRSSVRTDRVRLPSSTELSAQGLSNVRACSHGFLSQSFKIMEVFSPPRVTEMAKQRGFLTTEPPNFDLTNGWNTLHFEDRRQLWKTLEEQSPDLVLLSPDCRLFSVLMNVNLKRIAVEKLTREQMEALTMWHLCIQVASFQLSRGKFFLIEQPAGASSWATHTVAWLLRQKGVLRFLFDQCELGLQVSDQGLSRKATGIVTNHTGIAFLLSQYQCTKTHHHVHLESGLPKKAQTYPKNMIQVILDGLRIGASDFIGVQVGSQELVGEDSDSEVPVPQPRTPGTLNKDMSPLLTPEQKKKIQLMHLNMGHLPKEQMLSMLKAAGAKEGVMKYVKDSFNCEHCMRQRRPIERRHAALPRTFMFNRIVGVDFLYLSFENRTQAFLNVICQGTNYQQVAHLKNYEGGVPSSQETWLLFCKMWIHPFGIPETVVTDGGSEFKQQFERSLEQFGALQIITDAASPWQNSKAERHGGWVKERAEMEVNSGQTILSSVGELEELVICMVACKNRWFSRGGYSPSQLVFGINPRVPTELLDDDPMHDLGWREIDTDPYDQDTAASAFTKAHHIRHRARQLCIEATSRDKIKRSSSQRAHKQREWAVGQWVYVWRRFPGTGQGHLTRARWTGPGIVVLQVGHTVWVSMRARLWKCNSDQLRPASHHESIGADLSRSGELQDLIRQGRSAKAGAVDVTAEGTPDEEDTTSDPSHDQVEPMVSPAADVPAAIQLEPTPSSETPPVETTSLLRNIREPQAAVPIEDDRSALEDTSSMSTIKEGRKRPTSADETTASKKKQTAPVGRTTSASTRSKRQISETEHLERVALRTMKRMDREEKMRRLKETSSDSAVNPQTAAASSDSVNESAVPNQLKEFQNQFKEEAPQDKKDLEEDDDLFVNSSQEPQQLLSFFELKAENKVLMARPAKPKSQEFNMHEATPAEMRGFREADAAEWRTILDLNAVKILSQEDSRRVRKETPHRILPSRFVRRKKPMPGVGQWKFKSRWCVLGHCDPDNGTYSTYSPMPTTESIAVFFQICANLKLSISFCDVKQAFCQSEPLCRPQGELYVEACPGLDLPKDTVIQLIAPVYGLEDAPIRWHQTVISYLGELGFQRSLLEPCWYYKRDNRGDIEAMILVEVDDLNVAARSDVKEWILKELSERFLFGKMEHDEADFAGRHVKVLPDRIEMHQEKYILEKIQPVKMTPGRKAEKADQLTSEEFELFRSMLYRIAWVTHQTRPEAAGVVSILASRLKEATIHDVCCLNRLAAHLRNTAQQVLTIHSFKTEDMVLIAASDAGGVDSLPPSPDSAIDNVQGAWVIMAAGRMPSASQNTKVSILSWRSSKLRRRVASTLASEALAFSQALAEVEWVQIMIRDVMYGDVLRRDWMQSLNPYVPVLRENCELHQRLQQCHVTDAKSLFDSLQKKSPSSRQDRRTSIELSIIIESMAKSRSALRWAPHPRMIADSLTKDDISKTNGALEDLLRTSKLSLWDEEHELRIRKESPTAKNRSRKASARYRAKEEMNNVMFTVSQINLNLGVLFHVSSI